MKSLSKSESQHIRSRISEARARGKKVSRRELRDKLRCSSSTVTRLLNTKYEYRICKDWVEPIASVLDLQPEDVLAKPAGPEEYLKQDIESLFYAPNPGTRRTSAYTVLRVVAEWMLNTHDLVLAAALKVGVAKTPAHLSWVMFLSDTSLTLVLDTTSKKLALITEEGTTVFSGDLTYKALQRIATYITNNYKTENE